MSVTTIRSRLLRNLSNLPGWRTRRKILVIESDDWGSIRMPSLEAFNLLLDNGLNLTGGDSKRYNLYDTLATPEDLQDLFEILFSHTDKNNNYCVFTAICVLANPDFQKIKESGFRQYYYEPFTDTLKRYYGNDESFKHWKEGIKNRIFEPQFHGREHLNVSEWMRALRKGDEETLLAFNKGLWGFVNKSVKDANISYQAAFDFYHPEDLVVQTGVIKEGLSLFEKLFGYKASVFVPPNGPINNSLEKVAAECGIKYISASKIQIEPQGYGVNKNIYHYLGQSNKNNQRYITRNCFFEPSQKGRDWIASCLKEIEIAFRWHKPAVISSHRVNYIGVLDIKNKENGLRQLNTLLTAILKRWPEVEFMTSNQLGNLIDGDR